MKKSEIITYIQSHGFRVRESGLVPAERIYWIQRPIFEGNSFSYDDDGAWEAYNHKLIELKRYVDKVWKEDAEYRDNVQNIMHLGRLKGDKNENQRSKKQN